jgi:hypothetical protein
VLRLADQWIWDSWIADDGECYHLFFLQTARPVRVGLGRPRGLDRIDRARRLADVLHRDLDARPRTA